MLGYNHIVLCVVMFHVVGGLFEIVIWWSPFRCLANLQSQHLKILNWDGIIMAKRHDLKLDTTFASKKCLFAGKFRVIIVIFASSDYCELKNWYHASYWRLCLLLMWQLLSDIIMYFWCGDLTFASWNAKAPADVCISLVLLSSKLLLYMGQCYSIYLNVKM